MSKRGFERTTIGPEFDALDHSAIIAPAKPIAVSDPLGLGLEGSDTAIAQPNPASIPWTPYNSGHHIIHHRPYRPIR